MPSALALPSSLAILWPLALYGILAAGLAGALLVLAYFSGERHTARAADQPFESGIVATGSARLRLHADFYLIAMLFVIFDVESAFLYAWAGAVRQVGWAGYAEAMVFIGVLLAALVYVWRLGVLDIGHGAREDDDALVDQ